MVAEAVAAGGHDPWDLADHWAHAPRLPDQAARAFAEAMAPAASLTLVDDPLRDEAPPSHLGGGPGEHR